MTPQPDAIDEQALRAAMVRVSRELVIQGLNRGTSGNVSVRCGDCLLITPTGVPAAQLDANAMVKLVLATGQGVGEGRPSSEWRFHRDILAGRPEINAVVHVHSPFATTLACLGLDVPPFHYMIAAAGGCDIRCAPYALFGTQELSDHVMQALRGRKACLLGNHGMLAAGRDIDDALAVCVEVESLCEMYWRARQIGEPARLTQPEMDQVIAKFSTYGAHASGVRHDA